MRAPGAHSGTLVNALLHHFATLSRWAATFGPASCIVWTNSPAASSWWRATTPRIVASPQQFAAARSEKYISRWSTGRVKSEQGRITAPIARDPVRRIRMTARIASGRAALTEFEVLKRYSKFTLLRSSHRYRPHAPDPGASGQHRASRGRRQTLWRAPQPPGRLFLHAWQITFSIPGSDKRSRSPPRCPPSCGIPRCLRRIMPREFLIMVSKSSMKIVLYSAAALFSAHSPAGKPNQGSGARPSAGLQDPRITLDVYPREHAVHGLRQKGRFVTDLNKDDFEIFESKKPQTIIEFTAETDLPLRLAILIDTSNSIRDRFHFQQEAATDFIDGTRAAAPGSSAWSSASTRPPNWWPT